MIEALAHMLASNRRPVILFSYIVMFGVFYYIGDRMFRQERHGSKRTVMAWTCVLAPALLIAARHWFGERYPGGFLERGNYEAEFYVNLFPKGAEAKNYRVPALIQASSEDFLTDRHLYYLQHVTFPNGGRRTFHEYGDAMELGERAFMKDDSGDWWYVEMTGQRYFPKKKAKATTNEAF